MNILEELYYGNVQPNCKEHEVDSQYVRLSNKIEEFYEKLMTFLRELPNTEEQQRMLIKIIDAHNDVCSIAEYESFIDGFRLGANLIHKAIY